MRVCVRECVYECASLCLCVCGEGCGACVYECVYECAFLRVIGERDTVRVCMSVYKSVSMYMCVEGGERKCRSVSVCVRDRETFI